MTSSQTPENPTTGSRIWLTGASYGLGRALAVELARGGAFLGLTARREDLLAEVLSEVEAAGGQGMVLPGDVTDRAAMNEAAQALRDRVGGIDMLVANAGSHVPTDVNAFDVDQYMGLMNLNFTGALNCIDAVLPDMLKAGAGHIVGMASLAGFRGVPTAAAYGASKAALIHFLESMRFDVESRGVKVTVVNPGFVRTPLTDKNTFRMPFLMEPDKAARVIRRGLERGRLEITFPFPFSTYIKLLRILPMRLYVSIMRKTWDRMKPD
ncbi:MAG: SDR family NAD(P)-dependent oxidoreductase [Phycisphaerales bacterium]|nr:SDR family NAD(P)-dependent oxidoreductase [Phycisphaerales bacterium]